MAHALLLSPATRFDSPDSSSGSLGGASSLSPATPPPPSLDFLEDLAGLGELDTPSRGGTAPPTHSTMREGGLPSNPLPEWLTDELGHDWLSTNPQSPPREEEATLLSFIQDDDDDVEDRDSSAGQATAEGSTTFLAAPRQHEPARVSPATEPETPAPNRFPWQSQPRVPSSLRHGFTAASSPSTSVVSTAFATDQQEGGDEHTRDMSIASTLTTSATGDLPGARLTKEAREEEAIEHASSSSSAGSDSVVVTSVIDRGSAAAERGDNEQLQAAVRALKGPNGGLFAAPTDPEMALVGAASSPQPKGLLGLFQPPSPPQENNATPLPKSTRPAPSLSTFTFSAPNSARRTSWKDLDEHLSPPSKDTTPPDHDDAHQDEAEATPVARPLAVAQQLATPRLQGAPPASTSPTAGAAVGKRGKRFLKRPLPPSQVGGPLSPHSAAAAAAGVVGAVATSLRGPRHAAAASETESSSDDDEQHFGEGAMLAVHLADNASGATTTTDEEDHSSTDVDDEDGDEEEVRSGGVDGGLLLGESKPGLGWSSDEDEDERETEPLADDKVHAASYLSPGAPPRQQQQGRSLVSSPPPRAATPSQEIEQQTLSAPRSPMRVPLPAVSHASTAPPPSSPFKLFQPIHDTVTRSHLAALVDEIDTLDQSAPVPPHPDALSSSTGHFPLPPPLEGTEQAETSDEGFLGEEGEKRSSKRIRLSPRVALERIEESPGGERKQDTEKAGEEEEEGENNRSIIDAVTRRRTSRRSSGPVSATRRPPLSRRRRDAYLETERIMDRVRRKENEPHLHDSPSTRSMLRISGPRPPVAGSGSHESSVSPPTLPKLAAAASASIRSALSSSAPPSPSLSHGLPSSLNEQQKGSYGRRQFARTPVSQARKPRPIDGDRLETSSPSAVATAPSAKAQPTQNAPMTYLHPQSSTTQRLLASAGSSARDKGLVFDAQQGRWIRTRRWRGTGGSEQPGHGLDLVEASATEEEEDPFRDLSEIRSDDRSTSALAASVPRVAVPPAEESTRLNLSGLGITEGTPPLPATKPAPTLRVAVEHPSPGIGFEPPPVEARPADEHPDGPRLQLESEDSATWGRDELEHKQRSARRNEQPSFVPEDVSDSIAPVDDSIIVESSMLNLYRRAHTAQGAADDEQSTRISPPASSKKGRRGLSDGLSSSASHRNPTQPPRSALKNPRSQSEPVRGTATPIASRIFAAMGPPRSVSFSDGKTSGKIEGLVDARAAPPMESQPAFLIGTKGGPGSLHFEGLETQSESEAGGDSDADRTMTRADVPSRPSQDPKSVRNDLSTSYTSSIASSPSLTLAGSRTGSRSFVRTRSQNGNATFLTECSFGVSHDRLLQYIPDVEPFEPNWEDLRSIDLSGKKAEGVVRLKEFLPNLDEVNLNDNEVAYLTGIPPTLRTLLAASNRLTDLTSFQHLSNLERLDISNNQLESVRHLACLRHLRELKADNNRISNLDGLADLDSLVRISLKNNDLSDLDFSRTRWTRLETLHLARNRISNIRGFERLQSLSTINLDHNRLTALSAETPMPRLRILRVCQNPLPQLDVAFAPRLRTIYADSAQLGAVQGVDQLIKLENLSVRDQSGGALTLSMPHLRDVKRLYLSGNPLPRSFPSEKFFNLVYLELAMCQLSSLPDNLAAVVPNVRVLNLNHNFLSDLSPLSGLTRCTRLSLVGARVAKARHVAAVLTGMPELQVVDLRMNPLTLAFYPPLVPSGETLLPAHAEHRILHPDSLSSSTPPTALDDPLNNSSAWLKLDTKFRRSLPDEWYHRRAAYRAVLVQSVPALSRLDGIDVAKERGRLAQKLEKLAAQPP